LPATQEFLAGLDSLASPQPRRQKAVKMCLLALLELDSHAGFSLSRVVLLNCQNKEKNKKKTL